MKKFLAIIFMLGSLWFFSQYKLPGDLIFNTKFLDAESKYVVLNPEPTEGQFIVGVPYFDDYAGYTFRLISSFAVDNGNLVSKDDRSASSNATIARWQKLDYQVAVLNEAHLKQLGLVTPAPFLRNYKSDKPANEQLVNRASSMNANGYSNFALPILEKLRREKYADSKFYFELIFAFNALKQFDKANSAADEALNKGFKQELILKEKHFALLYGEKADEAADFLKQNLEFVIEPIIRSEMVINQLSYYNRNKNIAKTREWINIHKNQIGKDRFTDAVLKLENEINNIQK